MPLNIRPMFDADIDKVYAIERDAHITPWSREIIRDCVMVGYDCKVLELYEEKPEEAVIIGYSISRYHDQGYHILNICITKAMQAQGLGKKFLRTILGFLKNDNNVNYIVLEVRMSNLPALKLYEGMGFIHVSIKKDYYKDKEGTEDAIVLKKYMNKP
ncbi:ribosomal protein S18-alanine N-acetyltransferase [Legionella sp. km772]|uniref:ribosomal protein S18-alanine N-acetyltransferase n=1 Tax=Legionella sp. km772 TaxID=2498111 RepID=UPI000F8D5C09|nr:ribosomal protein S18-alanine N-acetyltransferase [Legionella sp. km772]RUR11996.1 ribosomal-protein-alanine N-acetyltransferase [Legionella sp. km772]